MKLSYLTHDPAKAEALQSGPCSCSVKVWDYTNSTVRVPTTGITKVGTARPRRATDSSSPDPNTCDPGATCLATEMEYEPFRRLAFARITNAGSSMTLWTQQAPLRLVQA